MKIKPGILILLTLLFLPLAGLALTIPLTGDRELGDSISHYLHVDGQGRIYIADRRDSSILILSPEGKKLARFGRQGEGPGEFKRWFGAFGLTSDNRILQADFFGGNRSLSCFSPEGQFQWAHKIQLPGNFGIDALYPTRDGRLILVIGHGSRQLPKGEILYQGSQNSFYLAEESGKLLKEMAVVETFSDFSNLKGQGWPRMPFQVDLCSAYDPGSGRLAYQKENEPQVHILDIHSGQETLVANGFAIKPQTQEMMRQKANELMNQRGLEVFRPLYKKLIAAGKTIEENLPIVSRLLFTDTGELLIAAARSEDDQDVVYGVLDQSKRLHGPFSRPHFPGAVVKGQAYDLVFDDEEGYSLIIGPWQSL